MHSTARRCGYPSVSIRAAREPARGAAGELSLANAVFRRRRSTTSPPPPGPAASVAGFGATRPDRGPGGLGTSHPPPLPAAAAGRARRHPPGPRWVAWRVGLTADRFRITGPAGRAPPSLILGVSWAARWCAGSPELCTSLSAEPVGQSAGSCGWGAAAGPVLPRVDRQRGRLGRGAQPQVRNSDRHPGRSTGTVSQGQSSAEACSPPRSAASGPIATEARVTPRTG
jgi:hypothetical protein